MCCGYRVNGWSAGTANCAACSTCSTTPPRAAPAHALISGDAGVGKTRLVSELAARARGPRLHRAVRPVRRAGRQHPVPAARRRAARGDHRPRPGPGAARRARRPPGARRGCCPTAAPARRRPTCRASRSSSCSARSWACSPSWRRSGPVLLVLEDVHWADRSTRDLLTFLSRVLHRERVAVVVTYRTDDLHRRHPLRPVVAELLRLPGVTAIELAPLGYADMADHLSALAAEPAGRGHPAPDRHPGRGQPVLRRGTAGGRELPRRTAGKRPPDRARRPAARPDGAGLRHRPAGAAGGARWPAGASRTSIIRDASGLSEADFEEADPGSRSPISCSSRTASRGTRSGTR